MHSFGAGLANKAPAGGCTRVELAGSLGLLLLSTSGSTAIELEVSLPNSLESEEQRSSFRKFKMPFIKLCFHRTTLQLKA